jgi:hypothetical protein
MKMTCPVCKSEDCVYLPAEPARDDEPGVVACWECNECGNYFDAPRPEVVYEKYAVSGQTGQRYDPSPASAA